MECVCPKTTAEDGPGQKWSEMMLVIELGHGGTMRTDSRYQEDRKSTGLWSNPVEKEMFLNSTYQLVP